MEIQLLLLQLVGEGKLGSLFLKFSKFILVLGHLLEGRLDELALHVTYRNGQLIDLEVAEDDLTLQKEHLPLKSIPLVKVLLADLLQLVSAGGLQVGLGATPLGNHSQPLLGLPLLLLLDLLGGLLPQKGAELLLALGGHESLLLAHVEVFYLMLVR